MQQDSLTCLIDGLNMVLLLNGIKGEAEQMKYHLRDEKSSTQVAGSPLFTNPAKLADTYKKVQACGMPDLISKRITKLQDLTAKIPKTIDIESWGDLTDIRNEVIFAQDDIFEWIRSKV